MKLENRYLFRGKRLDTGEWAIGYLFTLQCGELLVTCIETEPYTYFEIDSNTVGQCTGFKDKKQKLIFEGDCCEDNMGTVVKIKWGKNHQWSCEVTKGGALSVGQEFPLWQWDNRAVNDNRVLRVIGN